MNVQTWNGSALNAASHAGSVSKSGYPVVWLASIFNVTLPPSGSVGIQRSFAGGTATFPGTQVL
ncbi:MAG TPA: hypothetical protein VGG54_10715 [Trebonia sp.]